MAWWSKLLKIGAIVGAPFTGGASLAALPVLGAIGGALGQTRAARTSTREQQNQSQFTNLPMEAPGYGPLGDMLRRSALTRITGSALPAGFVEGGISNINRAGDLGNLALSNELTARGLSQSPVAATALTNTGIARQGEINQLENVTAPMLEEELRNRNFQNALNLYSRGGVGTTGTRTSTGKETAVAAGSPLAGAFSSAAELLAYLYGSGAFNKQLA